jgi:superfamily II DNA/RNA helicase|tara:strand:+ start:15162 stop:16361 length:1200 start_codon:yes stop_codon:yes gene_type:complete
LKFSEIGFHPDLLQGIDAIGFESATPIQEQAIPVILAGKDLIGSAQTGTGKTAAFLLPIINDILTKNEPEATKCLIVVPTRELAIQIDQQMQGLSYFTRVNSIAVYGGGDGDLFAQEKKALSEGASVITATPGRLIAHLKMGYVNMESLRFLVLDEADRMLDMGFHQDIQKIISFLPKKRQNLMFSATMPPKMRNLAKEVLSNPEEINVAVSVPADKIIQVGFVVHDTQKIPMIEHVLSAGNFLSVIVFCSTKDNTKNLTKSLKKLKFSVAEIHSDLDQKERGEVLNLFKAKKLTILVATDILSRGIDIEDIELVINYDVPNDVEDYIHRIGRTARAAAKGVAFTFINEKEQRQFGDIEKFIGRTIDKAEIPVSLGVAPDYNPDQKRAYHKTFHGKKRR